MLQHLGLLNTPLSQTHLCPPTVTFSTVAGESKDFAVSFLELIHQLDDAAQLCGAHRGVVGRVGEQDGPSGEGRKKSAFTLSVCVSDCECVCVREGGGEHGREGERETVCV